MIKKILEKYGPPKSRVLNKKKAKFDDWSTEFINSSTFFLISSKGEDGALTISPRGGEAGFVFVRSDEHLLFQEDVGNNLFSTVKNIYKNPTVGLLFMIPGKNEFVRVSGEAKIISEEFGEEWEIACKNLLIAKNKRKLIVEIKINEWYYHCGRSAKMGKIWDKDNIEIGKMSGLSKRPSF